MTARTRGKKSKNSTAFTIPLLTPEQRYQHKIQAIFIAISEHDFHAVADLAMDIRELIAAFPALRKHDERLWSRK